MSAQGASFPKHYRLLTRPEFLRLSESASVASGRSFVVVWKKNTHDHARLGITAGRKAGNAVVRNRVKRIVREFFRHCCSLLPDVDLNVIVRRQAAEQSTAVLVSELRHLFRQIGSRACCHE